MDGATGTVSATDNASTPNTYVVDVDKAAASPSSSNARVCTIRAYLGNVTSLTTITITHPSVTARAATACVFVGINQSTPLDKTNSAVGSSTTPNTGATGVLTQANELVWASYALETSGISGSEIGLSTGGNQSYTAGAGDASNMNAVGNYSIVASTTTLTGNRINVANTDWAAAISTYKTIGTGVGTPKLMNNGTEGSALTLTEAAAAYMNIADVSSYPSNAAAVGMRSSNDEPDTFMYETGMLIAYKPSTFVPRYGYVMHSNRGVF